MWKAPSPKEKRRTNRNKKKINRLCNISERRLPEKTLDSAILQRTDFNGLLCFCGWPRAKVESRLCGRQALWTPSSGDIFFFFMTTGLFQELLPLKPSSTAVSIFAELLGEGSRALTSLPVRAPHKHSIVCENVQCAQGTLHIWQLLLATSLGPVSTPPGEDCMHRGGCAP